VETLATTVRPSVGPLEVAEVAGLRTLAKMVGGLEEGHLFTGRS